jgi:iron complex transport system substrate-binding protein
MTEIFTWICAAHTRTEIEYGAALVAVSEQCDWSEPIKSLPRTGSLLMPDYERIAALKPDIVLASYEGNPPALTEFLQRMRIPLYAARIDSIAALYTALTNLSLLFFPGEAMDWEAPLTAKVHALHGTLAGERIFFQIGSATQAWSFGRETLLHDLMSRTGAHNLGANRPGAFPQFDGETLARLKPSLVILLSGSDHKHDTAFWNRYAPDARIESIPPNPFERPGPRLIEALLELSAP